LVGLSPEQNLLIICSLLPKDVDSAKTKKKVGMACIGTDPNKLQC
jgi:hypothetical protein